MITTNCHTEITDSHRFLWCVLDDYDEWIATDYRGFSPYPLRDGFRVDEKNAKRPENKYIEAKSFFLLQNDYENKIYSGSIDKLRR